ncbi:uncharacterized protein MONOS_17490 [Monocercomonoides exilis]|uniref:uncharacterized protein n=1 Tax=Monocercomonoides exilis TaxID=2049356 RepID=UPI003559B1B4|nr:hypothetical protein MONOS_17490 [Monocercomonoides exilis]
MLHCNNLVESKNDQKAPTKMTAKEKLDLIEKALERAYIPFIEVLQMTEQYQLFSPEVQGAKIQKVLNAMADVYEKRGAGDVAVPPGALEKFDEQKSPDIFLDELLFQTLNKVAEMNTKVTSVEILQNQMTKMTGLTKDEAAKMVEEQIPAQAEAAACE